MIPPYMLRHAPLITSRISFVPAPPAPLPTLTPRTAFTPERLKRRRVPGEGTESAKRQKLAYTPLTHSGPHQDERRNLQAEKENRNETEKETDKETDKENDDECENDDNETNAPGPALAQGPKNLISKPGGEPGRRNGGYSIEDVLVNKHQWSKAAVEELQKVVRTMAGESLNLTLSFSKQDKKKIQGICAQAQERWPDLARYEDCWPVRSILKLSLKYRSEYSRRAHDKGVAERVRSAALGP